MQVTVYDAVVTLGSMAMIFGMICFVIWIDYKRDRQ